MARRSSSLLLAAVLVVCLALCAWQATSFVSPPSEVAQPQQQSLRGAGDAAQAAALGAALASLPDAAHAANQGYAVLQLGWAIFIISLGPAVLFWIYFNKPELL